MLVNLEHLKKFISKIVKHNKTKFIVKNTVKKEYEDCCNPLVLLDYALNTMSHSYDSSFIELPLNWKDVLLNRYSIKRGMANFNRTNAQRKRG